MDEQLHQLVNYGVLGIFACAFLWATWRIVTFLGHRLFDDQSGLFVVWVTKQSAFLDGLADRDIKQQELCSKHANYLGDMTIAFQEQRDIGRETALCLRRLVQLHEDPNGPTSTRQTNNDLASLKQAALVHCAMCRAVVVDAMPDVADKVRDHLDAMEKILK